MASLIRNLGLLLLCASLSVAVKVKILHTTDIHGWVDGHSHNSTLNADFGDFHSLLLHMHANAISNGEELFLFDTGDLIEGTGMSDATAVHGQYIFDIIMNISTYTAMTMGNHDIGHPEVVNLMRNSFIPFWNGSYLTANSEMEPGSKPIANPYTVFTTALGTKVLVLGYLFNFTHEANNTYVVPVSISLTQSYFQEAMQVPGVDMIVVCSHIAPQFGPELQQIYKAIRAQHPATPLVMLAGHSHVTYFANLDANAFTIESGKYFEVLGVIDFEIGSTGAMENLETQWIDTSVENFMALSGTSKSTFDTPAGLATSQLIEYYASILGLNITYGCSPSTYSPDVDYSDPYSLYQLYVEQVIPKTVFNTSDGNTPYFISNTQSLRYNLYSGPVTRNDIYTISPFNDTFVMYQGFPGKALAGLMQAIMNTTGIDMNLNSRYCAKIGDYNTPNWYTSSTPIVPSQVYDVVLASYDAETIYYTVRKLFGEESFAKYVNYPTENNGTGALQVFIEQFWPCKKE